MTRDDLAPRIFFNGPITIEAVSGPLTIEGTAHNLSSSGLFVHTRELLTAGSDVRLSFILPDGADVHCTAQVVRTVHDDRLEPTGLALAFGEMEETTRARLEGFISGRLQPAEGEALRLTIDDVQVPIAVRTQTQWEDFIAVDAELPFLALGKRVGLTARSGAISGGGEIRWVSVHVPPESGTPRLNIGIELSQPKEIGDASCDEEHDPICSADFVSHSEAVDKRLRAERKAATG